MDLQSPSTVFARCLVLEGLHTLNAHVVKWRLPGWRIASELDSSVIHVLLFANAASFYRSFTPIELAAFWLARFVAEHATEKYGGLIDLKAKIEPEPSELKHIFELRQHMMWYGAMYILTSSILMHAMIFDHIFVLTAAWGFPMTVGLAYHYMHTKASWSFYAAHLANLVTNNPPVAFWALEALKLGRRQGAVPILFAWPSLCSAEHFSVPCLHQCEGRALLDYGPGEQYPICQAICLLWTVAAVCSSVSILADRYGSGDAAVAIAGPARYVAATISRADVGTTVAGPRCQLQH
jgi:hypothetical protein